MAAFGENRWPTMVTDLNRLVMGTMALSDDGVEYQHPAGSGATD